MAVGRTRSFSIIAYEDDGSSSSRRLLGNGGETGRASAELSGPETADDRLESRLFRPDSKRRQTSLVRVSQVVVRLRVKKTRQSTIADFASGCTI